VELTKAELEELCRKAAQKAYEEGLEAGRKEATTAKSKYKLDHSRKMGPDDRDPRHLGEGPCQTHRPKGFKNHWGEWQDCVRCAVRLVYIPYEHASAQYTKTDNEGNVRTALQELKAAGTWKDMNHMQMRNKIKEVAARAALKTPKGSNKITKTPTGTREMHEEFDISSNRGGKKNNKKIPTLRESSEESSQEDPNESEKGKEIDSDDPEMVSEVDFDA
jgi:hypothetical protein